MVYGPFYILNTRKKRMHAYFYMEGIFFVVVGKYALKMNKKKKKKKKKKAIEGMPFEN
jgi:hypothetical protein